MTAIKPTKILEKQGAYKKNPNRARIDPITKNLSNNDIPKHFTKKQKDVWNDVISKLPEDIATNADTYIIEQVVLLICYMRDVPVVEQQVGKIQALTSILDKLGLTPVSRAKMAVPAASPEGQARKDKSQGIQDNPFAQLIDENGDSLVQ